MSEPITKGVEEDLAYWSELATLLPTWRLMGFTYRTKATYVTPGHYGDYHTDTINLTGKQRDELVAALREKGDHP